MGGKRLGNGEGLKLWAPSGHAVKGIGANDATADGRVLPSLQRQRVRPREHLPWLKATVCSIPFA